MLRQESGYAQKTIRRFRLTVSGAPEVAFQSLEPGSLPPPYDGLAAAYREFEYLIGLPEDQRTEEQATTIRHRFRPNHWPPWQPNEARFAELAEQRREIEAEVPTTMIMREMEEPRPTFVLRRGEYNQQTDEVSPAVPSFLPPIPEELPKNRLGLARWLVSEEHPLTARVTANRMWQRFFGRGLVGTSGDFGSQGEWPSRFRLDAEVIRDGALAAAALLRVGEQPVDESIPAAELAAWSVAASALLNLDEAVTRL